MMTFISAFVVCGGICLAGQLIYDNTKLTAGHITSIFVVIGAAPVSYTHLRAHET